MSLVLRLSVLVVLWAIVSPCPSGFYARDDYSCAMCPSGKYKTARSEAIPDPHPCFSCLAVGEWSEDGAAKCACNTGYGGIAGGSVYGTCAVCAAGKFKSTVGDGDCAPCSQPSLCGVGFFLDACVPARDYACKPCTNALQPNTEYVAAAPMGSHDCPIGCGPGYADVGGECVACPAGSFKAVVGPHALNTSNTTDLAEIFTRDCQQCPAGKFSPAGSAECTSCRDSCDDGFIVNGTCAAGAAQDAWCTPCPQHTYRDSSAAACIACDPKSRTLGVGAPAATSCKCIEGYTIVDTFDGSVTKRTCQPCPVHTFSLFGEDYCSPCDSNAQAPAQSTSSAACQCNAGYTGASGARCRACASGSYKSTKGPQPCTRCKDHELAAGLKLASTPLASVSESACVCPQGYEKDSSTFVCKDIDECAAAGACTANALCENTPGSSACICEKGFYEIAPSAADLLAGNGTTTCLTCPPDTYKDASGKGPCTSCPPFSTSPGASSTRSACVCKPGYYGPQGGPCAA